MDFSTSSGWCGCSCSRSHINDGMRSISRLVQGCSDKRDRVLDCGANTHSNCAGAIRLYHRKCDRKVRAQGLHLYQERRRQSAVDGAVGIEAGNGRSGGRCGETRRREGGRRKGRARSRSKGSSRAGRCRGSPPRSCCRRSGSPATSCGCSSCRRGSRKSPDACAACRPRRPYRMRSKLCRRVCAGCVRRRLRRRER